MIDKKEFIDKLKYSEAERVVKTLQEHNEVNMTLDDVMKAGSGLGWTEAETLEQLKIIKKTKVDKGQ